MATENKKQVTITLTPKAHEKIKRYAKETHTNVSAAIEHWIWNELDEKFEETKDKEKNN